MTADQHSIYTERRNKAKKYCLAFNATVIIGFTKASNNFLCVWIEKSISRSIIFAIEYPCVCLASYFWIIVGRYEWTSFEIGNDNEAFVWNSLFLSRYKRALLFTINENRTNTLEFAAKYLCIWLPCDKYQWNLLWTTTCVKKICCFV